MSPPVYAVTFRFPSPINSVLIGQVARTGQGLKLTAPAEEASFNGTIDLATGTTMGLFVVPILSWSKKVVGVLQVQQSFRNFDHINSIDNSQSVIANSE